MGLVLPGLSPISRWLTTLVTLLGHGFNAVMVTSPLALVAIFGVAILTGYDVLCRVIKWVAPIEETSIVEDGASGKRESQVDDEVLLTPKPHSTPEQQGGVDPSVVPVVDKGQEDDVSLKHT